MKISTSVLIIVFVIVAVLVDESFAKKKKKGKKAKKQVLNAANDSKNVIVDASNSVAKGTNNAAEASKKWIVDASNDTKKRSKKEAKKTKKWIKNTFGKGGGAKKKIEKMVESEISSAINENIPQPTIITSDLSSRIQEIIFSMQSITLTSSSTMKTDSTDSIYMTSSYSTFIPTYTPTPTKAFFRNNGMLKQVFKTVLFPGLNRAARNVVFEYADDEENKTCRCVCRMGTL